MRVRSSIATLTGLAVHYCGAYLLGFPLWTDTIAEWIMARTPSRWAVVLLDVCGPWAKPLAATGGLATLGLAVLLIAMLGRKWMWFGAVVAALGLGTLFGYSSPAGQLLFWIPAVAVLRFRAGSTSASAAGALSRREVLVMAGGVAAVAAESYLRNRSLAARAVKPTRLGPLPPSLGREEVREGLVRKRITPVDEFYGMSKNTVDPVIDPATWRLKITHDGETIHEFTYAELLSLPRMGRFVTLRCISNTLKSDLMGTAHWTGIHLSQLLDRRRLHTSIIEMAAIGADGHGDSYPLDYAFSNETMFALGMNGETLTRTHGFPIRLLTPRYYGLKHVKWIAELAFVSKPYIGTWPKLGYTKEPVIHTASHFDRVQRQGDHILCGGVSFAGNRGIRAVQVRLEKGPWVEATLEPALSEYTLTRWTVEIPFSGEALMEARAQDGSGAWQSQVETPLFPNGVDGPSFRSISS
ncbi:MAG: molybdopterin-dependent oxidoreductase [Bryobacteraceae bacterium]